MSEMIERVAQAIFDIDQPAYAGRKGEMDQAMWEKYERHYLKCARAAVAAMREPTQEMHDAAVAAADKSGWADECRGAPGDMIEQFHRAMIDAALSEEE